MLALKILAIYSVGLVTSAFLFYLFNQPESDQDDGAHVFNIMFSIFWPLGIPLLIVAFIVYKMISLPAKAAEKINEMISSK